MLEEFYRIRNAKDLRGDTRQVIEAKREHTPGEWGPLSNGTWVYVSDVKDILDHLPDMHEAGHDRAVQINLENHITWILRRRGCIAYSADAKVIWRDDLENDAQVAVAEYE